MCLQHSLLSNNTILEAVMEKGDAEKGRDGEIEKDGGREGDKGKSRKEGERNGMFVVK